MSRRRTRGLLRGANRVFNSHISIYYPFPVHANSFLLKKGKNSVQDRTNLYRTPQHLLPSMHLTSGVLSNSVQEKYNNTTFLEPALYEPFQSTFALRQRPIWGVWREYCCGNVTVCLRVSTKVFSESTINYLPLKIWPFKYPSSMVVTLCHLWCCTWCQRCWQWSWDLLPASITFPVPFFNSVLWIPCAICDVVHDARDVGGGVEIMYQQV